MTDSAPNPNPQVSQPLNVREISSTELFQGDKLVVISHSGEQYRLSITRNDKLILQK